MCEAFGRTLGLFGIFSQADLNETANQRGEFVSAFASDLEAGQIGRIGEGTVEFGEIDGTKVDFASGLDNLDLAAISISQVGQRFENNLKAKLGSNISTATSMSK